MSDSADELILQMQHLEAQARATREAERLRDGLARLKTAAQKVAWDAQKEIAALEMSQDPDAPRQLVRARAKLNAALDKMTEVERRDYEAFEAEVRAETHGQLAEDPLFKKG